ncbi:Hypothetical protein, conserved [Brucella ceti str. Cudo]|uniref:Uncharacterized protein n=1 Tax=Brucella ceti str. Cudo TaxID=595497 RepID=C0G528_9HYPH|nr:Hypothetical protein, conserved [Brucella ceti str. Cudo]
MLHEGNKKPGISAGFLYPIRNGLERTLEANDTAPSIVFSNGVLPLATKLGVGNFRRNGEARNQFVSNVSRNCRLAPVVMRSLQVEGSLLRSLILQTTPDSPIAAPLAVVLIRRSSGRICALQPNRELVGDVDVATNLGSPFFDDRVIGNNTSDRTPAASILQAANNVRHVAVDVVVGRASVTTVVVATLFESDHSREAVSASEGVRDLAGAVGASRDHVIVDDIAEVTGEGMEFRFIDTNAQTTELDIRELHDGAAAGFITIFTIYARIVAGVVEAQLSIGAECAEFGFRIRVEHECETSALVPAFTIRAGINVVAALYVVTDVAADAQAGFGARNVEVASAVSVANADIFNGFGLWRDDCVGSLSAGSCNQSCSGAKEKALDVHF